MLLTVWFVFTLCLFTVTGAIVYPCKTPDDDPSYCVSLFSCPHLMKALGSLEPIAVDYVRQSMCLGCDAGDFMVCCGTPNEDITRAAIKPKNPVTKQTTSKPKTAPTTQPPETELMDRFNEAVQQRLLPDFKYCGFQHTDDRVHDSPNTAIDEFPWLVHIRFSHMEYEGQYADRCNGVLINNRYVLTNAYCGTEAIKVKLGEYNTNKSVSCDIAANLEDCTDPVLDLPVEEIIRDGKQANGPYDFALLRLNQTVPFSDFIRPICLPVEQAKRPNLHSVVISGWGASDNSGVPKKRLIYNIVEDNECYKEESWLEGNIKFANVSFVCTKPVSDQVGKACTSEHGGPFMYDVSRRHQWFVDGIIVNVMYKGNENMCSKHNPVNGIKITEDTIDWILSTIRP
ncbi:hypothetical protein RN001_004063 [Aquatica leii]|uniref:CLIP domain-containing serine protease n=1 Tax=Aquatica leii TaxID=1421715 RepID=A0AAN7SL58_9COLE|nr:hypothetical protein RN001_004063 [Aquatica leii]